MIMSPLKYFVVFLMGVFLTGFVFDYTKKIPEFKFETLEGKAYNKQSLGDKPVIVIHFSPHCGYTQQATSTLIDSINLFEDKQILMVTRFSKADVSNFIQNFNLNKHKNITVVLDKNQKFADFFEPTGFPSFFLYDKDKNFIEKYRGLTDMKVLDDAFNKKE